MEWALATYILTILIPINGIILLGMHRERQRIRKVLLAYWKLGVRRGSK